MNMNNKSPEQERKLLGKYQIADKDILEKYEFRSIRPEEADEAAAIEQICFPPNEACSQQHMKERIAKAPELFLVAVDRATGRLAGFLSGLATDESTFRDEFFTDADLYHPAGKNIMLLGLDVLPEYRRQGIAKELVYSYAGIEGEKGRQTLILTCLQSKVKMYEKMGFIDKGISNSTWGGEEWHEMSKKIGIFL
jgi:ribosomal protein S18 acetylase RimI-like enzyme